MRIVQIRHWFISARSLIAVLPAVLAVGVSLVTCANASTLFALVDTGELFASTDGGDSWSVRSALPVSDAVSLFATSTESELFLASRSGTVYRSPDAGNSWNAVGAAASSDVVDLTVLANGTLLALTRSGVIWGSPDGGASFDALASITAPDLVSITRGEAGVLLALTETGTVSRSSDDGESWNAVGVLTISDAVAIRPLNAAYYVLTDSGVTYESVDQGDTWLAVGTVSQVGMRGLTEQDGELVAIHRTGRTVRTPDGAVWTWTGTVNQVEVAAIANDIPQTAGIPEDPGGAPRLLLMPPRPNPLPAGTAARVEFLLPTRGSVSLQLFGPDGRRVAMRTPESFPAGTSALTWSLPQLASGVYFLRLDADGDGSAATRLVIAD